MRSYKSLFNKDGWYVHDISTEKENGNVLNFLEKEDIFTPSKLL